MIERGRERSLTRAVYLIRKQSSQCHDAIFFLKSLRVQCPWKMGMTGRTRPHSRKWLHKIRGKLTVTSTAKAQMSTQDGGGKGEAGTERVGSRPSAELSFTCMLDEAESGWGRGKRRALVGLLSLSNLLFIDYLFLHTNTGNSNLQQRSRPRDAIYVDEEERFWQCIRERRRERARRRERRKTER